MAKKVFISAGHGGSDPGAVANGFVEKDLNLEISIACRNELARHGVTVKMDRETDVELTMSETVNMCNSFNPDLAVNIHNNAGGGDGAEVFYSIYGTGKTLALNILDELVKIGQNSRGAKTRQGDYGDYYGFIRMTDAPAVIVECAFLDNRTDVQIIDTPAERVKMGEAIARGVLKTLGIDYNDDPTPAPSTDPMYRVIVSEKQRGAFRNLDNALAMAKEYLKNKDDVTITVRDK